MRIEIMGHPLLGDVDWNPRGLCALTGPNGIGKSTLLRVFHVLSMSSEAGTRDGEFNSENVRVDGQSMGAWLDGLRARGEESSWRVMTPHRDRASYIPEEYGPACANLEHVVRGRPDQEWVLGNMKQAFPHMIDPDSSFLSYKSTTPFFLRMLYDLRAVARAREEAVITFDHPEEGLHPFAIRVLIGAFRERAEQKNLTIILETMHPEVLNEFRGYEDQVYLLGHEPGKLITLADIVHEDELPIAYIGERFLRERFCPQSKLAFNRRT